MNDTKIEWCDSTINFWSGCAKVSPGCANCYAETMSNRNMGAKSPGGKVLGDWGRGATRRRHESAFRAAIALNKKPWICDCCGKAFAIKTQHDNRDGKNENWGNKCVVNPTFHRRRIFSLSMGDWLDDEVPIQWLADMLKTIHECPDVDWLLVTKRPELWEKRFIAICDSFDENTPRRFAQWVVDWRDGNPPGNVMVIASIENQAMMDKRLPELLSIPAARRGFSMEPLLGEVTIPVQTCFGRNYMRGSPHMPHDTGIHWVIIGGESGDGARPINLTWIRKIIGQCKAAKVPVFVKQLGAKPCQDLSAVMPAADVTDENATPEDIAAWEAHRHNAPLHLKHTKGGDMSEWQTDLRVREFYE